MQHIVDGFASVRIGELSLVPHMHSGVTTHLLLHRD